MKNNPLPRLDTDPVVRDRLLPFCRLKPGEIWDDPEGRHRIGCKDAANSESIAELVDGQLATLAIHDPPYNLVAFDLRCRDWIRNTTHVLSADSSLYVWLGADQNDGFQPLPDFMVMMRSEPYKSRSFITMRNQRGYGTQKNWMAVRQELLYYTKGSPVFNVNAESEDTPWVLQGSGR
jgi:site-specific DNA-methyltransferase (adenine-specific)